MHKGLRDGTEQTSSTDTGRKQCSRFRSAVCPFIKTKHSPFQQAELAFVRDSKQW